MRYTIRICSLADLPAAVRAYKPTHLLSLCPPGKLHVPGGVKWEVNCFADTESTDAPEAPTPDQISRILAFGRSIEAGGRLTVHCEAGVSRSTAIALALLVDQGLSIEEAGDRLMQIRPQAHPNALVVKMADKHLGLAGRLLAVVPGIRQHADDYLAEQLAGG